MSKSSTKSERFLPIIPVSEGDRVHERNSLLLKLCCANHKDCIHRRVCETLKYESLHAALQNSRQGALDWPDLGINSGRDIWGETALHLIARWAPSLDFTIAINFLLDLASLCETSFINIGNVNGDTFMHILARQWHKWPSSCANSISQLIHLSQTKSFNFSALNRSGLNFFGSLLPTNLDNRTMAERCQIIQAFDTFLDVRDAAFVNIHPILISLRTRTPNGGTVGTMVLQFLRAQADYIVREPGVQGVPSGVWRALSRYEVLSQTLGDRVADQVSGNIHDIIHSESFRSNTADTMLEVALLEGADANEYDSKGLTPMMVLIDLMDRSRLSEATGVRLISHLLAHHADLRIVDGEGNTVLHHAVHAGLADVVQFLITRGVNVHAKNAKDQTAPQIAIRNYQRSRRDVTNMMYVRSEKIFVRLFDAKGRRSMSPTHETSSFATE
jgi:Ankyrin repeats (many copies)